MKCKTLFSAIALLSLLSLSSCFRSGKNMCTNYFVAGEFAGVAEEDSSTSFLFVVKEIAQQEYEGAGGLNVVNDYVLGTYFSIELTIVTEEESTPYDFVNMRLYSKTPHFRATYHDDKDTWITPHRDKKDSPWNYLEHFYQIQLPRLGLHAFFDPVEEEEEISASKLNQRDCQSHNPVH